MIGQLTKFERQVAMLILLALAGIGLTIAIGGRDDPIGVHGVLIVFYAIAGMLFVISGYFEPEPGSDRFDRYYDEPTKAGIILAMIWAAFALTVGAGTARATALSVSSANSALRPLSRAAASRP